LHVVGKRGGLSTVLVERPISPIQLSTRFIEQDVDPVSTSCLWAHARTV
jgi:hypothetical protein